MLLFNSTIIIWDAISNKKMFDLVKSSSFSFSLLAACIAMHPHQYLGQGKNGY